MPENELADANLHDVSFDQAVARHAHAVDEGAGCGTVILYLVSSIRQVMYSGVEAADGKVFQEDVAVPTAPDGHIL